MGPVKKRPMNKLIYTQDKFSRRLGVLAGKMRRTTRLLAMAALLTFAVNPVVHAADTDASVDADSDAKDMKGVAAPQVEKPALGSSITGLLNFEFSDKYYTPRGLTVTTNGPVFQPLLILFFNLYSSDKGPLTDLSFNMGIWNDVDFRKNGVPPPTGHPGNWDELDGFFGMEAKLYKDWKLDAEETFFKSQTDSYADGTSTNFTFTATYLDHWFGDSGFSINPYGEVFVETSKKATVCFDTSTASQGFYCVLGLDPTYKFKSIPLTVELPTSANYVSEDFYQRLNGTGGGAGLAVITTELKATTPISFIPINYGAWTAYAGVQYLHLDNAGLLDGNQALTNNPIGSSTHRDTDLYQLHAGITCFF